MNGHELVAAVLAVLGSLVASGVLAFSLAGCYGGGTGNCVSVYYSQNGVSGVITKCGPYSHEPGWY